jgi:hypothetical protein
MGKLGLKETINKEFPGEYFEEGGLPGLLFRPEETRHRLLLVAGEHGDKPYSSDAVKDIANELKNMRLISTEVTILPIVDIDGYPDKRTSAQVGDAQLYFDKLYGSGYAKGIESVICKQDYDMSAVLNTSNIEESPNFTGFYVLPQAVIENNKIIVDPFYLDFIGSTVQDLKNRGLPVINRKRPLGANYLILSDGLILPFEIDNAGIATGLKYDGFMKFCNDKGKKAIGIYATSSTDKKGSANKQARESLYIAGSNLIKLFEQAK